MKKLTKTNVRDILLAIHKHGRLARLGKVFYQSGLKYAQGKSYKAVEQNPHKKSVWAKLVRDKKARVAWLFSNTGGYAGIIAAFKADDVIHLHFQDLDANNAHLPEGIKTGKVPTLKELETLEVSDE